MNDFVQDTWQDLREKRLWPVAVALVIAIVAIPMLLTKSAAQPPAVNGTSLIESDDEETRVAVTRDDADPASTGTGSALDRFEEGDPFTPPARIANGGGSASASASAAGPAGPAGGGDGAGDDGGSAPSGGTDSEPVAPTPPTTRTETREYEYVADVTFWNGDRRRRLRGLRKLDMLPNQSAPVLIFMGSSEQGGNAVFLVDSTLTATGEGNCVPSGANCAYVHIGPGSEHLFTTEVGDSYRLRVDEIRRVRARGAEASAAPTASTADGSARRFQLPSLADLVEVSSTTTTAASSNTANGR
jgi:hypothetical protein